MEVNSQNAQLVLFVILSQIDIPNLCVNLYLILYQKHYLNFSEEYTQKYTLLTEDVH